MHEYSSVSYQHTKLEVPSFTDSKDMIGAKFKKRGHVTLTTPTTGESVIPKQALDIFYLQTKFGDSCSEILSLISQNLKTSSVPENIPFRGNLSCLQ